jgi:hypothetical protein
MFWIGQSFYGIKCFVELEKKTRFKCKGTFSIYREVYLFF